MLFTMFVLFLFGWLFFHSIGLALHLTWCAAKVIAALLFAVALPVLLVFNLPFTFFKGMLDAVICFAIYKPLSPILHGRNSGGKSVTA